MSQDRDGDLLRKLRDRTKPMLDDLERLVLVESPSSDPDALDACAKAVVELAARLGIELELVESGDRVHVRGGRSAARVLILGHFDTVWSLGTTARWGFSVADGRASGPGTFDMKAGIVQGLHALAVRGDLDGVEILFTSDEEIGSETSRALIEAAARRARAVLVLEPSADGSLKVARKGCGVYRVRITGRAAHAGLDPDKGVNAVTELAHQVIAIGALDRPEAGTTVSPTIVSGGTATNTIPATAEVLVDARVFDPAEAERVDAEMNALAPVTGGATIEVSGAIDRPPMPRATSAALFERAQAIATELGIGELTGAEVGGGSDGNLTAAVGTPTLDGLGAVGGGAHAEGEWIEVDRMAERAALVARLVDAIIER